jgi:molybdate transport system regulatory protein
MAGLAKAGFLMPPELIVHILFPAPWNLGPGKFRLLEAISEAGSLSGAARKLHISYKRAWDMLDSINRSCPAPLVETAAGGVKGGGAKLTARGVALLTRYRELESSAKRTVARDSVALMKLLES